MTARAGNATEYTVVAAGHFAPAGRAGAPVIAGEVVELVACRCQTCGRVEFPSRARCVVCLSETVPYALGGAARVRACTHVTAPAPGALISPPYDVCIADFVADGVSVIGLLHGVEAGDVDVVGAPVQLFAAEIAPGIVTFAFACRAH